LSKRETNVFLGRRQDTVINVRRRYAMVGKVSTPIFFPLLIVVRLSQTLVIVKIYKWLA
jgi:hypothetical protein